MHLAQRRRKLTTAYTNGVRAHQEAPASNRVVAKPLSAGLLRRVSEPLQLFANIGGQLGLPRSFELAQHALRLTQIVGDVCDARSVAELAMPGRGMSSPRSSVKAWLTLVRKRSGNCCGTRSPGSSSMSRS